MFVLNHRYLSLRLTARSVVVSDQASTDLGLCFRNDLNDSSPSSAQPDPLNATVLKMFDLQVSDDLQR